MKTNVLFIEARKPFSEKGFGFEDNGAADALNILPKSFLIAYTIQYKYIAEKLKDFFEKNGRKIKIAQVLGCSKLKTKKSSILLVGSGRFHALQLALQGKSLYVYENGKISRINKSDADKLILNKKIALSRFLSSESIGIIVSSKTGQNSLNLALNLKKKMGKLGKKSFIFLSDAIDFKELENFSVDSWVNTACPGIAVYNSSRNIINYMEIEAILA